MANKILIAICFFVFVGHCIIPRAVFASWAKQAVKDYLRAIKNKDYKQSYEYFSSSLKSEVNIEDHIANLKDIEKNLGKLVSCSDRMPIFRNYILDEDMFSGLFDKKQQLNYKYFLNYERGSLVAYIKLINENNDYKISVFNLEIVTPQETNAKQDETPKNHTKIRMRPFFQRQIP